MKVIGRLVERRCLRLRRKSHLIESVSVIFVDDLATILCNNYPKEKGLLMGKEAETVTHVSLVEALKKGGNRSIKTQLDAGANPNASLWGDEKVIHWVTCCGSLDALLALLAHGAEPNVGDRRGVTPLHEAAERGDASILTALLDHGADVHARDNHGNPPLHYAAQYGHPDLCTLLLDRGAELNAVDSYGHTAVHSAAWHEDRRASMIPKVLLEPDSLILRDLVDLSEVNQRRAIRAKNAIEFQKVECTSENVRLRNFRLGFSQLGFATEKLPRALAAYTQFLAPVVSG